VPLCPACGAPLDAGALRFCSQCGAPLPGGGTAPALTALVACAANAGRQRGAEPDEDSVLTCLSEAVFEDRPQALACCILADGMGGLADGQVASRLVIRTLLGALLPPLLPEWAAGRTPAPAQAVEAIRRAVALAGAAVRERNAGAAAEMGSTVVLALLVGSDLFTAAVGDSRVYLLAAAGRLTRLHRDDSLVESLVEAGTLTREQVYSDPRRNVLTRSLGMAVDAPEPVAVRYLGLAPGDRLLLCSDGLWEMLRDERIAAILGAAASPGVACRELVAAADAAGGEDNISAAVLFALAAPT